MREYIISFEGRWHHFFIKQHVGLCCRRKDGLKFGEYEVLLKGAEADFCVYSTDKHIHIVCQDEGGSVLYLFYNGNAWKKSVLLESRMAKPYNKNFKIINLSGYLNVIYTVCNKERVMLVHQIIADGNTPAVVDYIKSDITPFCILSHRETDFSVFYTNEEGVSGKRIYKWSQKTYSEFIPVKDNNISIAFTTNPSFTSSLAAVIRHDEKKDVLSCFKIDENNSLYGEMVVCDDFFSRDIPVISAYGEKIYMVWTEYGGVVTSCLLPDGTWSAKTRYAKSNTGYAKLYSVCHNGNYEYYYGIPRENDISLYGTHDILKNSPLKTSKKEGTYETNSSEHMNKNNYSEQILKNQQEQIKKLFEELTSQKNKLSELTSKIEDIISTIPIAADDDIDKILMN